MLDSRLPLSVNVDRLIFDNAAPLRTEYDFLFRSLFKLSDNYQKIAKLLSKKLTGLTRDEISAGTGLNGGDLTQMLKNLDSCDFIRTYCNPTRKEKGKVFQLTDMFTLFFLRFVEGYQGRDEHFWTNMINSGLKNAWSGYAFEQTCLHHIGQIKKKLGISGIQSDVYAWSEKAFDDPDGAHWDGGQIDLIIDRSDNVINLCEMKYSNDEYSISGQYAAKLRSRESCFRRCTRTTKALRCTFVTVCGIKRNEHSDMVADLVTAEDLFC